MEQITDLEAKELGVNKEVFQKWSDLMQSLWIASINVYKTNGSVNAYLPSNKENQIFIGSRFIIDAVMINSEYVDARLHEIVTDNKDADAILQEDSRQLVEIRYDSISAETIAVCMFKVIEDLSGI